MDIRLSFSYWMRHYRNQKNYTQEILADMTELHRTYIGSVERGERNITLLNANKIAEALGVKLSDMVKDIENGN